MALYNVSNDIEEEKSLISYFKNVHPIQICILLNHFIHSPVHCQWFTLVFI